MKEYICHFKNTLICSANSRFAACSLRCKQSFRNSTLLKISISSSEKVSFTTSQFKQKYIGRNSIKNPGFMRVIIGRESEDKESILPISYIASKSGQTDSLTISEELEPGEYLAWIEIRSQENTGTNFIFRTY